MPAVALLEVPEDSRLGRATLGAIARPRPPVADHVSARAGFVLGAK